jgi:hypothetical protein
LEDRTLPSSYTAATVSDLIADINAANQGGGANTITLAAGTTFTLKRVDNTTDGATGLPVIAAGDQLTLLGNGDTVQRSGASGAPAFRLFDVASGASLTLENLTLQNGLAFGSGIAAWGGALYNQGSLLLSAVTVQDNIAQGADGVNGTNSYPIGTPGQSGWGGGIYSGGSLTLENGSQLVSNQALGGNGGNAYKFFYRGPGGGDGGDGLGGGLFVDAGTVNLTNTTVGSNQTQGGVAGASISGDPTVDGTCAGAGIYISSGTFMGTNVTVVSNQLNGSGSGISSGGIYGGGIAIANGTVTLSDVLVQGNLGGPAGGIYIGGGTIMLSNASVQGNYGGVYIAGGVVTLSSDTIESNSEYSGIYIRGGTVTLSEDTVQSNSTFGPGGGILIDGGTVTLCGDTVQANTTTRLGGGIYIRQGTVFMDPFTVAHTTNNTDSSGQNGSTANIDGSYTLRNC